MIDLEPINIICHSRRDPSSYLSIMEILNMYDLDGLNYKIWVHRNGTSFDKGRSINYTIDDYKLNSGNLFRLDILVWELPTTIHPTYIERYVKIIRQHFNGTIILIGENIDSDYKQLLDNNYPIYYIKKIERKFGFKTLSDLRKEIREDSHTIEDNSGNIQTISSWKTTFIRDRKLENILDENKRENSGDQ